MSAIARDPHSLEVREGERFEFGANWSRFLAHLDDERIAVAEESLRTKLGVTSLAGRTFLDVGSGSGLFSLAARRLGARVHSFDYDPQSVACAMELRARYFNEDPDWRIERGSVLDRQFMESLGQFDIVYSWGVLHHTGQMWVAITNAAERVAPNGEFFIAIYNDQGGTSRRWRAVKRVYNRLPALFKPVLSASFLAFFEARTGFAKLARFQNPLPFAAWRDMKKDRGMSRWHDVVDWVGGYPFEVATPEEIFYFLQQRSFQLTGLKTCGGGLGCNEFVFRKA